jgi:hypothetical protein
MYCTFEGKRKLPVVVHWVSCRISKYCLLLLCMIALNSCETKHVCISARNNGKPQNYNRNLTRWAKYNAKRCSGYTSMGIVPTKVVDSDYEKTKRKLDKQARRNQKRRLHSNLPII